MRKKTILFLMLLGFFGLLITGCGGSEGVIEYVMTQEVEVSRTDIEAPITGLDEEITYNPAGSDSLTVSRRTDRLIIKDAQIKLQVENTDTAIDRTTQIVSDAGGYIISSRTWYEGWGEDQYKNSTITIGVPSDRFENTLRRLRDIAIRVLDENASGEDVTDEFVDLQSRLENLTATRDRIRGFLEEAETVEEALKVNAELSKVEGQIEEIQGRINYLSDRAAFSTITVTLEPEIKDTPRPTSTPEPWNPGETFNDATRSLSNAYKGLIDNLIWLFVVVIPVVAPFILITWLIIKLISRNKKRKETKEKK